MKVIMYGTHLCKDTLYAIYKLEDKGADLEFRNISASLTEMKAFLKITGKVKILAYPFQTLYTKTSHGCAGQPGSHQNQEGLQ